MQSEKEEEAEEASEEEGLTFCKDSKHRAIIAVIFLVGVSKSLTRSNLRKKGFSLTHSLMLQPTMGKAWQSSCKDDVGGSHCMLGTKQVLQAGTRGVCNLQRPALHPDPTS